MVTSIIRRRPMAWMVVVSLAVLALVLTACGSDSGSSTASSTGNPASSAGSASVMTVNVKESKGATGGDVYSCDPTTITVKKGDSVTFTNMSDENQDFDQGDSVKAGVDFKIGLNQSIPTTFKTAGTFTIKSEKGATFTVTVQ